MKDGFAWACEFGRTSVVDFLLQRGMEVDAKLRHDGQTGLHWAAYGGHADTVKLLLERGAPVDAKDESYDGTPLEWALYGWGNSPGMAERGRYYEVVALLVRAGAKLDPEWYEDDRRPAARRGEDAVRPTHAGGAPWRDTRLSHTGAASSNPTRRRGFAEP